MGVHGLTTFLRENRKLATTTLLPSQLSNSAPVQFVIDGWSFIYEIHLKSNLPWVYGGEYLDFTRIVTRVVQAWIDVGIKLVFVFDGPVPEIKFTTLVSRLAKSHIEPALLFFRTSPISRSTARFLNESRIIPPLSFIATIHALDALRESTGAVDLHFADEEGDPYAVELAGRLGAYVVGNDSDFVILNAEGYLGYVPWDEMVWMAPIPEDQTSAGDDDDFQQVRSAKHRKKPIRDPTLGRGIIPPDSAADLSFSFTAYSPDSLASLLNIPITILPLLGALVGNDYSNQSASTSKRVQSLFFDRQLPPAARINKVANTLQSLLFAASQKKRPKHQVDSVMDLIDKTVRALLNQTPAVISSGEVDAIVDRVVESTLQYAIAKYEGSQPGPAGLWSSPLCALHEADVCQLLPMFSRNLAREEWEDEDMESEEFLKNDDLRRLLIEAYRSGRLSPNIMNSLNTGTLWPRLFLENPDIESTSRITKPIREWCCAILDDAVGLPEPIPEEEDVDDEPAVASDEDEDELVDVVESDSEEEGSGDVLAPLKGALQRLRDPNSEVQQPSSSSGSTLTQPSRSAQITEYVRRGARVVEERVSIRPLAGLLQSIEIPRLDSADSTPLLLQSLDTRLTVMLRALESDISHIRDLPPEQILTAMALRWVLRALHNKAQESGSKESQMARWTRREARCFLASFDWERTAVSSQGSMDQTYPPISDRHVQLVAQVLQSLESVHQFAQVLLLSDRVSTSAHLFSGKKFHAYLTGTIVLEDSDSVPRALWDACAFELDDFFGEERVKKAKKKGKGKAEPVLSTASNKNEKTTASGRGLFDLLGDVEA